MRRATLMAVVAIALASQATTAISEGPTQKSSVPAKCLAKTFRSFSAAVWNPAHWRRAKPKPSTIAAQRSRIACAGPGNRRAMQLRWRDDRSAFYRIRRYRLRWGNCSDSGPVPDCIHGAALTYHADEGWLRSVSLCESTWNRFAQNPSGATGLFQFLPSTWSTTPYGEQSIYSAKYQSLAAAWMYVQGRSGEWVCQ